MYESRKKMVNYTLVVMGVLGYLVMILPWFDLSSSSYIRGYGSSSMDGGSMIGFSAAYTTFFGYALYALPAAAIALALKVEDDVMPPRAKAIVLELIGAVAAVCLYFLMSEMKNYDSDISGYGYSAHAGYSPTWGFFCAYAVYAIYVVSGIVLMAISPKEAPKKEEG